MLSNASADPYPGDSASSEQILDLAKEYRDAAILLKDRGRKAEPLSWAPCRLAAIQSIELYLNALLVHRGHKQAYVRGLQHSFKKRAAQSDVVALKLRKNTAAHLDALDAKREYLVTRYGPEMTGSYSQINRLIATLDEIAKKVAPVIREKPVARPEKQ